MLKRRLTLLLPVGALVIFCVLMVVASQGATWQLLDTKGSIAHQQRDLLYLTTGLMLLIIIPIIVMMFVFAHRYRDSRPHPSRTYRPRWADNTWLEVTWWGIPFIIIGILGVVAWQTSHTLDPYRPLAATTRPVEIQVIGLQWRWLFMYPEEGVASLNELHIPVGRPANFTITSDAPMNSFWIPQLGGQIYAMPGMSTKLHLIADKPGIYDGVAANITGKGHAGMKFKAHATSQQDFDNWLASARNSTLQLDKKTYEALRRPSTDTQIMTYQLHDSTAYQWALERYHMEHHKEGN